MLLPKPVSDEWGWIEWLELTWGCFVAITVLMIFLEEMYVS